MDLTRRHNEAKGMWAYLCILKLRVVSLLRAKRRGVPGLLAYRSKGQTPNLVVLGLILSDVRRLADFSKSNNILNPQGHAQGC